MRSAVWSAVRRGVPLLLAGVLLLALFEVHGAIVRQTLRMLGVGSSDPTVLMAGDGCGHAAWLPPALAALAGPPEGGLQSDCATGGHVLVLMPEARRGVLFLNGEPVGAYATGGRLAWFSGLRWRPGLNLLVAWPAETTLRWPLPAPDVEGASQLFAAQNALRSGDAGAQALLMRAGMLSAAVAVEPLQPAATTMRDDEGISGRHLTVTRGAQGQVTVKAEACLPPAHPVLRDAPAMKGPELLSRLFTAMVIGAPRPADDASWRRLPRVEVGPPEAGSGCTPVRTAYEVEQGLFTLYKSDEFLDREGDHLQLTGFGDRLRLWGRPPLRADGDVLEWTGAPGQPEWQLMVVDQQASARLAPAGRVADPVPAVASAGSAPAAGERRQGLLVALADLRQLLPPLWEATAWALASAAPAALILWALRRGWPTPRPARLQSAHTGMVALLAFMAAFALQPVLLQMTHKLVQSFPLLNLAGVSFPGVPTGDLSAPIALCAALLIVPLLRGADLAPAGWSRRIAATLATAIALALLGTALVAYRALQLLPADDGGASAEVLGVLAEVAPAGWLPGAPADPASARSLALALLLATWASAGLVALCIAAYGLFRFVVPAGRVLGAALGAGVLLFVLPLTQGVADLAWVAATGLNDHDAGAVERLMLPGLWLGDPAITLVSLISGAFVVLVVVMLLRALREVAAAMLTVGAATRLRQALRPRWLLLAALVIVWPMVDRSWSRPQILHGATYQLMSFFQAFGGVLAVLVPLTAAQEHRAGGLLPPGAAAAPPFELPDALLVLMAATFAGYLGLWSRDPLAVALVMVAGWYTFRVVLLDPARRAPDAPGPGLAKALASHMSETRLLKARRAGVEKLYGEGKTSAAHLHTQRAELDKAQRVLDQALGMTQEQARERLFFHGPGATPLDNALRAAKAGVGVGLVLQLLVQFQWAGAAAGSKNVWLTALGKFVVDPQYRVIASAGGGSRVLALCGELLNAMAVWAIAGFLFGYVFHLIRGRDGFQRAALFGMGLTVPYLLSQALVSGAAGVPVQALLRVVPLLVFLLVVGALLFDGMRLRRGGVGITKLPEIYGLKTSVGYLSFAGLLAGVQPLLELLGWLSGS